MHISVLQRPVARPGGVHRAGVLHYANVWWEGPGKVCTRNALEKAWLHL